MSEPKESLGLFQRVARFITHTGGDWADLTSTPQDPGPQEIERSELKAMIERKRRNDFVRKREFDMLRKLRREGLSPDQLGALGTSSRLDAADSRQTDMGTHPAGGVKEKIDEIEQQMVGETLAPSSRGASSYLGASTRALHSAGPTTVSALARTPVRTSRSGASLSMGLPPLSPTAASVSPPVASEGSQDEGVLDPDLDEAVIAFANADFKSCEMALSALTAFGGVRATHEPTWLARCDLYRATGQEQKHTLLAQDFVKRFGHAPPPWVSLPKKVTPAASTQEGNSAVGWLAPAVIDLDAITLLRAQTLQMPTPWVLDWEALSRIDDAAALQLTDLFDQWARADTEMRWLAGEHLFAVLHDATPTGTRDVDPALWALRMAALRLANRPDQFDEAAIDYCMTYEVSPPSWEAAACIVRLRDLGKSTRSPNLLQVSEVSTRFVDSGFDEADGAATQASVSLAGQLVGDIAAKLVDLDRQLGAAAWVHVNCAQLIRVDFIAAGDLLNWVLAKRAENRRVSLDDPHRLVALFFGAMGINEYAQVRLGTA